MRSGGTTRSEKDNSSPECRRWEFPSEEYENQQRNKEHEN